MPPVTGALRSAGNCSIPLTLVVLGAYFYPSQDGADGDHVAVSSRQGGKKKLMVAPSAETLVPNMKGRWQLRSFSKFGNDADGETRARKAVPGETKTVTIAVLSRMIITPLLLMPFVALAAKFGLHEVFAEFVFPRLFSFICHPLMVAFAASQSCVCRFECVIGLVASGVDARSGTYDQCPRSFSFRCTQLFLFASRLHKLRRATRLSASLVVPYSGHTAW